MSSKRGPNVQVDEIQALLQAGKDIGVEDVRRAGGRIEHLFYDIQQKMASYGNFPERRLYVLKNNYLKAERNFRNGDLNPYPPVARELWGSEEHRARARENDEAWSRLMEEESRRCSYPNLTQTEKTEIIQQALKQNVESATTNEKHAIFKAILSSMQSKKLLVNWNLNQLCRTYCKLKPMNKDGQINYGTQETFDSWNCEDNTNRNDEDFAFESIEPMDQINDSVRSDEPEVCRICRAWLTNGARDLFMDIYKNQTYVEIIQETVHVQIAYDEEATNKICRICSSFTESLLLFVRQCHDSNVVLELLPAMDISNKTSSAEQPISDDAYIINDDRCLNANDSSSPDDSPSTLDVFNTSDVENSRHSPTGKVSHAFSDTIAAPSTLEATSDMENSRHAPTDKVPNASSDTNAAANTLVAIALSAEEENYRKFVKSRPAKRRRQCHLCGKSVADLLQHLLTHSQQSLECKFCRRMYTNKKQLRVHMNLHTKAKQYPCHYCDRVFHIWGNRKSHEEGHRDKMNNIVYKCDKCEKIYANRKLLHAHVRAIHLGILKRKCTKCDFCTSIKSRLLNHVRSMHTSERPYQCSVCDSTSNSSTGYYIHFQRHKKSGEAVEYSIKCAYCAELFSKDAAFEIHLERDHPDKAVKI